MKIKTLLLAATLLTAPAFATELPVAGTIQDPAKMPAGLYTLDSSHAHTQFFINHMGFSEYTGGFNDISGTLNYQPTAPGTSKLNVVIKVASINVQSPKLAAHLQSPDFFDATKYPEITFTNTSLAAIDSKHGTLTGNLTIHGVTKPVVLDVRFMGGGTHPMTQAQVMGFVATGKIKRSDFGITNFLPGLGDDVLLDISAEFDKVDTTAPRELPHQ